MVQSALNRLPHEHRSTIGQLVRYGIAGGLITLAVAAAYWSLAEFGGLDPLVSYAVVFVTFSLVSYAVHGAYSFRDHGTRDNHHIRGARFLAVNLAGFAINQSFVWLLVKHLGGPTWWPTLPMIFFTPLVTFALHRRYVYS